MWGYSNVLIEIEVAFEESHSSIRIFGNGVQELESLSTQLSVAYVIWLLLCKFMIKLCVALFLTSFINCWNWFLLKEKQQFKLGCWSVHKLDWFMDIYIRMEIASSRAYFILIYNENSQISGIWSFKET